MRNRLYEVQDEVRQPTSGRFPGFGHFRRDAEGIFSHAAGGARPPESGFAPHPILTESQRHSIKVFLVVFHTGFFQQTDHFLSKRAPLVMSRPAIY